MRTLAAGWELLVPGRRLGRGAIEVKVEVEERDEADGGRRDEPFGAGAGSGEGLPLPLPLTVKVVDDDATGGRLGRVAGWGEIRRLV